MKNKIIEIAMSIFDCEITKDSKMGQPEIWDSLGQLNLFMKLENEFNIKCTPDEIINHTSIKDIVVLIEAKLG